MLNGYIYFITKVYIFILTYLLNIDIAMVTQHGVDIVSKF